MIAAPLALVLLCMIFWYRLDAQTFWGILPWVNSSREIRTVCADVVEMLENTEVSSKEAQTATEMGMFGLMISAVGTVQSGTHDDQVLCQYAVALGRAALLQKKGELSLFEYQTMKLPFKSGSTLLMEKALPHVQKRLGLPEGFLSKEELLRRAEEETDQISGQNPDAALEESAPGEANETAETASVEAGETAPELANETASENAVETASGKADEAAPEKAAETASGEAEDKADAAGPENAGELSGGEMMERFYAGTYGELTGEELDRRLMERSRYYHQSAYGAEMTAYWENVREVRDVSNMMEPLFFTDMKYYSEEDFADEPPLVIHLAKNEIYARRGYIFKDPELYNYFMGCIWYEPLYPGEEFDPSVFNEYEQKNLELLNRLDADLKTG